MSHTEESSDPSVTSPACDVHFALDGPEDAPALVLSNSLGSTLAMWEPQLAALAERFRVVRYDLRGHGDSPVPDGPYAVADLGSDVLALLDRLGIRRASVCGVSLGGLVSMWLAAFAPERVERLVACSTSAWLGPPERWTERAAAVRAGGTGAVAEAAAARWITPGLAERSPDLLERLTAVVAATPSEGYAGCCEALAHADLRDDLGAIRAPTLVIHGADDPATPPEKGREIAAGIPGARAEVVPDAAHLANLEQPDAVTRLLLGHLHPAER